MHIENPCLSNCRAACCKSEKGWLGFRRSDRAITPGQITFLQDALEKDGIQYELIHTLSSRMSRGRISPDGIMFKGRCPFLSYDNLCKIYTHPMRPTACYDVEPAGITCSKARRIDGLAPLTKSSTDTIGINNIDIIN